MNRKLEVIYVKKSDLPIALVVEGKRGEIEVQELAPAGKGKLGAYVRSANPQSKAEILRVADGAEEEIS